MDFWKIFHWSFSYFQEFHFLTSKYMLHIQAKTLFERRPKQLFRNITCALVLDGPVPIKRLQRDTRNDINWHSAVQETHSADSEPIRHLGTSFHQDSADGPLCCALSYPIYIYISVINRLFPLAAFCSFDRPPTWHIAPSPRNWLFMDSTNYEATPHFTHPPPFWTIAQFPLYDFGHGLGYLHKQRSNIYRVPSWGELIQTSSGSCWHMEKQSLFILKPNETHSKVSGINVESLHIHDCKRRGRHCRIWKQPRAVFTSSLWQSQLLVMTAAWCWLCPSTNGGLWV